MVPGRRKEQNDVSGNRIYNKYNIAELQVHFIYHLVLQERMTYDFQSSFRYVDWAHLMKSLFGDHINRSQLFLVHFPSFLRQLDRVVSLFGVRYGNFLLIGLFLKQYSLNLFFRKNVTFYLNRLFFNPRPSIQGCQGQPYCAVCSRSSWWGCQGGPVQDGKVKTLFFMLLVNNDH